MKLAEKAVSIVKDKFADQIAVGVGTVVNKDDVDFFVKTTKLIL